MALYIKREAVMPEFVPMPDDDRLFAGVRKSQKGK